tara:strand:- start:105 stop:515 length:411 start_codon:yes stop_codon:yes gene_type:complete
MYEYSCEIVRVVDGDTVDVNIDLGFGIWIRNERIRLYAIDTPESRTSDAEEKKYGLAAKAAVEGWLPEGSKQVLITVKDNVGKFGRVLGKFRIDDDEEYLNAWLVTNYHAAEYYGQSKEEIKQVHLANRSHVEVEE